jgi:Gpi18-like mannosyltransferase
MKSEDFYYQKLWIFLGIALGIRLILSTLVYGYPSDMGCFSGWSEHLLRVGFSRFYSGEIFADYPPGYMYVLAGIGALRRALNLPFDSSIYLALLKMPALLADILLAFLLYQVGKRASGRWVSFLVALAFALNPAVILNSALWGQIDSFFLLPLAGGVFLLSARRVEWSVVCWVLAFLIKPQALIFAPLWLFALVEQKSFWLFLKSTLLGIGTFVLGSVPFVNIRTIIGIYRGTMGSYPYATLNAFNLFAFLGGNWVSDTRKLFLFSYRGWGYLSLLLIVFLAAFFFFRMKTQEKFYLVASFLSFSVFLFSHRMHERYLFPALFFFLLWYLFEPQKEILILHAGLSATFFINVGLVLLFVLLYEVYHVPRWNLWLLFVSALNCILWGFLLWQIIKKLKSEGTIG